MDLENFAEPLTDGDFLNFLPEQHTEAVKQVCNIHQLINTATGADQSLAEVLKQSREVWHEACQQISQVQWS